MKAKTDAEINAMVGAIRSRYAELYKLVTEISRDIEALELATGKREIEFMVREQVKL